MTGQLNKSPELFENWVYYCPNSETGLRWLPNQKWRKKDAVAGTVNCETGYAFLSVRKENKKIYYPAHKIVWYLHTKNWPEDNQINHINRKVS